MASSIEPFLFLAVGAAHPTRGSARFALANVDEVVLGRGVDRAGRREIRDGARRLIVQVPDPWMSREHARIARRGAELSFTDLGSSNGSMLNGLPVSSAQLRDGDLLELGHTFFIVRTALRTRMSAGDIVDVGTPGMSLGSLLPALEEDLGELVRIAPSRVSVVLTGPTGTGKEVLARTIHRLSTRPGPLIAVNCGAIPDELVESELFGHKKGAFSGATADRVGLVAAADGGTLLLDEIGDLPLAVQPALLRVLQERTVRPVGGTTATPVDFRLISATHRDLPAMVQAGTFRADLWARLNGYAFELPPLVERREDLGTLIAQLLRRIAGEREVALSADAARALLRYPWPRNVRELEMALESAYVLAGGGVAGADPGVEIDLAHLPEPITRGVQGSGVIMIPEEDASGPGVAADLDDPRRAQLVAALEAHRGNVSAVARALGKPRSQIQRWMRRWNLRGGDDPTTIG